MFNIKQKWRNSQAVVRQLKEDEWVFNVITAGRGQVDVYDASRAGKLLWVANGPFFCDVDDQNAFGLLFRHYVWWAAARTKKSEAIKKEESKLPFISLEE